MRLHYQKECIKSDEWPQWKKLEKYGRWKWSNEEELEINRIKYEKKYISRNDDDNFIVFADNPQQNEEQIEITRWKNSRKRIILYPKSHK